MQSLSHELHMRRLPGESTHPGQTPDWRGYASSADHCLEGVRIQGRRLTGEGPHPGQTLTLFKRCLLKQGAGNSKYRLHQKNSVIIVTWLSLWLPSRLSTAYTVQKNSVIILTRFSLWLPSRLSTAYTVVFQSTINFLLWY